ncbi:GntR family transcriptional regulator [Azospirillum sp. ST 5-10]|uniref:GntR family transcriptional regulator n=1 Tax=unclassified Azospirillum TaxID=2630922 RepID=UPI003F4A5AA1
MVRRNAMEETVGPAPRGGAAGPSPPSEPLPRAASLAETAYDRIEELIVHFHLPPGADVKMQTVQDRIGLGRTPTHQAVRRFAAETLIIIRPRDGLQISPIDLMRDRRLLRLRRDMDRFVVELAAERLTGNHRNQLLHLAQRLRDRRDDMDAVEFNGYDRALDQTILAAAGEPFLDRTLRPLHIVFRRIGWLYLSEVEPKAGLTETIDRHLDLLEAVINRNSVQAKKASDLLIDFADSMFDPLEARIAPELLDASVVPLYPAQSGRRAKH